MEPVLVGPSSKRAAATAAATLLCAALVACGGGNNPQPPGTPPSPTATATSAGHLHVLQHPYGENHPAVVTTYDIEGTSGHLRPPVTQSLGDARALASDPNGRFVYAAHGSWYVYVPSGSSDLTLAAYAVGADGMLTDVSVSMVAKMPTRMPPHTLDVRGRWSWITAGQNRVHGLWKNDWGSHQTTFVYVSALVAEDGRLGDVSGWPFLHDGEPGRVIADPRSDRLYKAATQWPDTLGGLAALAIQPDGQLDGTGWTNLCLGQTMSVDDTPIPLVAARDFLFASVPKPPRPDHPYDRRVCSYKGQRLKTWADLGFDASLAQAFVPSSDDEPALIAMNVQTQTGPETKNSELRLFSMDAEGDLQALSSEELPDAAAQILFHPSGRFLYLSDAGRALGRLRTYSVADGRLTLLDNIEGGAGSMAVSLDSSQAGGR